MVEGDSRFFQVALVAKSLGERPDHLTGIWSALTKRVRTVLSDPHVRIITWEDEVRNNKEEYIDQRAYFSEATYQSFRKAFRVI